MLSYFARGIRWVLIATTATCASAHAVDYKSKLNAALEKAGSFRVRYFDPEVSRSSISSVPDITGGDVDFDVTIKCVFVNCGIDSGLVADELKSASASTGHCVGPPYIRIDLIERGEGRRLFEATVDKLGRCMIVEGVTYRLRDNLALRLHETLLKKW